MDLKKYKVCPSCGERNAPSRMECRQCEADLTAVKIVDEMSEKTPEVAPSPEKCASPVEHVRICDCGAHNPPQARKCSACGEDISDILPTPVNAGKKEAFRYELRSVDSAFSKVLEAPVILVGRQAELKEYLCAKAYVSRFHARFTVVDGRVFVENVSSTNRTFVNNELLPEDVPTPLNDGDEIGLGGKVIDGERQEQAAYFVFAVKP